MRQFNTIFNLIRKSSNIIKQYNHNHNHAILLIGNTLQEHFNTCNTTDNNITHFINNNLNQHILSYYDSNCNQITIKNIYTSDYLYCNIWCIPNGHKYFSCSLNNSAFILLQGQIKKYIYNNDLITSNIYNESQILYNFKNQNYQLINNYNNYSTDTNYNTDIDYDYDDIINTNCILLEFGINITI